MSLSTRSKTWLAACAAMCCGSAALAQPSNPANDLCNGAIALTANVMYFSNTNSATQLNDGPAAPCQATSNNRGLWFSFVPPSTGRYQISASGSRVDTVLAVYSAVDCATYANSGFVLVPGGCNDDQGGAAFGPGATGSTLSSCISNILLTGGNTYWIRLSGFSNTTTGQVQIGAFNYGAYGACCSTAGVCTITMPAGCGVIDGSSVFLGDGSVCSPTNPCTGACCNNTTFACSITFPGTGAGGCLTGNTWQGFGTTCVAACNSGACCTSGAVCTTTTFAQCATTSNFQSGVACGVANAACYPLGACCLTASPFTCTLLSSGAACATGTFQGFGTTCPGGGICATGACCSTTSTCTVTVLSGCTGSSKFLPGGTCGVNPCTQACCNTTTFVCTVVTGTACGAAGTTLGNTSACSVSACASGACCTTAGVCTVVVGEFCAGTSQFVGVGSTCAVNPCTVACCDNTTLACSVVVAGTAGCTGQGLFTTCSPTNPCASLGKCCTSAGTCTLAVAAGCASTSVYTAGVSCTPNDCATFFGSCCNTATFVCSLASSAGNCTGTFAGLNTTCTTNPCPAPGNDLCANATVIPAAGPFPYSVQGQNATATDTAAFSPAICASSSRDVWYTFTPSTTAAYSLTLCNAYSGTFDTVLSIHSACPITGNANLHASFSPNCNDDGCSGSAGPSALGGLTMNAGSTYLIRVARWSTGAGAVFQMDITTEPFGACCDTALVCSLKTQSQCTGTAGSVFVGGGTLCSTSGICNGACCNGATGACTFTVAASCLSPSVHGGVGSTCTTTFCPVTTCCNNATGACTVTGTDPCPIGTTSNAATSCSPLPCTVSACCNNATGACTLTGSDPCPSGTTANAATSCSPTPCTVATCCNNATGACTTTGTDPCPSGTTSNASTTCSPTPCTISTCCNNVTGACSVTGTDPCPGGTTANAATSCSPSPCPAPLNDLCGNVYPGVDTIPGGGGSVVANLSSSTNDGNSTCQASAGKDVYYLFTPTVTGAYNLTTCTGSDAIDTLISIHVPGCPVTATVGAAPGNQIDTTANSACVDQGCGTGNLSNIASYTLTGGTQYMIRVALWSSSGTPGSATLTVTLLTPTGSCCDNATGTCSLSYNSAACASTATANASTTCSPSPCAAFAICCNNSTGACSVIYGGSCASGSTQGTGTVCGGGAPDANCPATACCDALGNCSVSYAGSCAAGTPAPGNTCSPNGCASLPSVCENFDAAATLPAGWTTTSTGAGAPWAIVTDSTNSAPNAVFSNDVATVSSQFLQLPSVTIGGTILGVDFFSSYSTEDGFDGFTLEISSDGGMTFTNVGDVAWTLNGYTDTISTTFASPIAGQRAFSGSALAWTQHTAVISGLTAGNSYIVRFHMASDSSVSATGVWLDNVCLYFQPNAGACCEINTGNCTTTAPGACGVGFNFVGGTCSPNPCPPPPGVCCRGATCSTVISVAANCITTGVNAGAYFATPYTACNASGNMTSPCCHADYDKMNGIQVADIFAMLNDWFAGSKFAIPGGNGTHGALAVQNIFDFLNLWFAGGC